MTTKVVTSTLQANNPYLVRLVRRTLKRYTYYSTSSADCQQEFRKFSRKSEKLFRDFLYPKYKGFLSVIS